MKHNMSKQTKTRLIFCCVISKSLILAYTVYDFVQTLKDFFAKNKKCRKIVFIKLQLNYKKWEKCLERVKAQKISQNVCEWERKRKRRSSEDKKVVCCQFDMTTLHNNTSHISLCFFARHKELPSSFSLSLSVSLSLFVCLCLSLPLSFFLSFSYILVMFESDIL